MSVSEKLRALDAARRPPGGYTLPDDEAKLIAASRNGLKAQRLLDSALPLIADVVEAAEAVTFLGQEAHRYNEWHGSRIVLALTALQDHLEER